MKHGLVPLVIAALVLAIVLIRRIGSESVSQPVVTAVPAAEPETRSSEGLSTELAADAKDPSAADPASREVGSVADLRPTFLDFGSVGGIDRFGAKYASSSATERQRARELLEGLLAAGRGGTSETDLAGLELEIAWLREHPAP